METKNLKNVIQDLTLKETIVDDDIVLIGDSEDENSLKKAKKSSFGGGGKGYKEYIGYVAFSNPDITIKHTILNDFDGPISITRVEYNNEFFYHVDTGLNYLLEPNSDNFGYEKLL